MIEKVDTAVSVKLVFDHKKRLALPVEVGWNGRTYPIRKIGLHHTFRKGRNLYHVFSVVGDTLFFRLVLDTETLFWKLEEVSDGLPT